MYPDGREEMSFVFDRIYGSSTPFILLNHIAAVFKKYRKVKQKFPECALSLIVTDAAMTTAGISANQLADRLSSQLDGVVIEAVEPEVDVVETAIGDHYVEFGGKPREFGKRKTSGLSIRMAA